MDLGLTGKAILVGGGSQGLGRGTAEVLLAEGAHVAIYALPDEHLQRAAEELTELCGREVPAIPLDVRDAEGCRMAIAQTVEELGGLDILVTNMASDVYKSAILDESDENWREEFELYGLSVIRLARLAVPHIRARGGGSIINLASCGIDQIIPELALSEVIRLSTAGFAKYLATALAAEGIRVNSVLPGWMAGERIEDWLEDEARARGVGREQVYAENVGVIPMGRFGVAADVGSAIAFLASERARYVTGISLRVDGGWALTPTG
jgi:3-oxoacyl-[acyl-carrier protein] reductase